MIDLDNKTDLPVNIKILEKIALSLSVKEIELMIIDDKTMQSLNFKYRNKNYKTDVLSFPIEAPFTEQSIFGMPLGSLVISASFVKKNAQIFKHSIEDELSLLLIHGILHLLGFNHETDNGEMRKREKEIISTFNLPKSLIIRTEEY